MHDALNLVGKHTPFRLSFLICRHGAGIQTMVFNSLHTGYFFLMLSLSFADFFQTLLVEKITQEYHQNVKQFGP